MRSERCACVKCPKAVIRTGTSFIALDNEVWWCRMFNKNLEEVTDDECGVTNETYERCSELPVSAEVLRALWGRVSEHDGRLSV